MQVTSLRVYPVKSMGGAPVTAVQVEPQGLAGDRRWCLVDESGEVVTARECHALLRLTAEVVDEDTIRITDRADRTADGSGAQGASILVDTPLGVGPVPISLSRLPFAAPADTDVSEWISARTGRSLRLVWQQDPSARAVSGAHGGEPGDVLSMADTGPLLLVSQASMARLDEWIGEESERSTPLDVGRFRANVVVDGDQPFDEDSWVGVRIGAVDFRITELCDRCVMTTLDPVTAEGGLEPIRTLARHRRWDGSTWFGTRLLPLLPGLPARPDGGGTLHVGDAVEVTTR